jgi:hypothetical protein
MKCFVKGGDWVQLGSADFVGRGGEGAVYVKGERAFKIHADAARVLPEGKLQELGGIADARVIVPRALVLERPGGRVIGYAMRRVADAFPLGQLATRAFQDRHGLGHARLLDLVRELAERVKSVHRAGCLVVDLNELNFLVDRSFASVLAIDCDSYQTPSYPATAIAAAVRDWRSSGFSVASDWFSFAVVSFRLLVGVHPYKGTHPAVKGLEERMRQGLSVLGPDVVMPPVAHPLAVIPEPLRGWYEAVLERGERTPPPVVPHAAVLVPDAGAPRSGGLGLELLAEAARPIRAVHGGGAQPWIVTDDGLYAGGRRLGAAPPADAVIVPSPATLRPVAVWRRDDGTLRVQDVARSLCVAVDVRADAVTATDGRVYVKSGDKIVELCLLEVGAPLPDPPPFGGREMLGRVPDARAFAGSETRGPDPRAAGGRESCFVASTRLALRVLPHATRLYDGVALSSVLGATYASVFPAAGRSLWLRLQELDGERVIDARCDWPVLVVVVSRGGEERRLVFRFRADGSHHDVRDDAGSSLRFVTLDNGVCAAVRDDGAMEIFRAVPGSTGVRVVQAGGLGPGALVRHAGKVLCARGRRVYRVSTRHGQGAQEAPLPDPPPSGARGGATAGSC